VDATSAESAGRWRELLAGAGVRRAQVSGSGIFRDAESDAALREAFFAGTAPVLALVIPDFGTVTGPFQVASLEYAGEHDGEATFEVALASAGALSFEAMA
jgi:TP901-1 family phage major tail protein